MLLPHISFIVLLLWFLLVFFAKTHKQNKFACILSKDLMNAFPFLNEVLWIVPISNVPPLQSNFNDLRYERNRFTTFQNFPGFVDISFIRLAESGFHYTGYGTNIQCIFCGATHENLDAYSLHTDTSRLHNHRCTLESRTRQGNTPMHPDAPYRNNDDRTQRLPTPDLPQYNHLNAVHANQQETETLSRFGIQTRMPKHPDFAIPESRRLTFGNSPEQLNDRAEEFVRAGFFYTGNRDEVRCFHCGKIFHNWSPIDDPWIVHARLSPDCTYMELNPEWTRHFQRIHRPHELLLQKRQESLSVQTPSEGQCQAERALEGHCRHCHLQPSTVLLQPCGHWVHDICKECAISLCECPICRKGVVKKSLE